MTNREFAPSLWLLVPNLARIVSNERGIDFIDAVRAIYKSELYGMIEDESTKLWHLSEYALASLLYDELDGYRPRFPEVAYA
jgi:hypothetical protein